MSTGFMRTLSAFALAGAFSCSAALWSASAQAQSAKKQCGDEWKAAKTAGTVTAGQKRADFVKECTDRMAAQPSAAAPAAAQVAPANPLKPAAPPAAEAAKTPAAASASAPPATTAATAGAKPATPGQTAERSRMKECGAEWRANKAQLVAATPGLKWPKYWSECNTRLKGAGK